MSRTLLTAALLGAFSSLATAQVTMYGRIDLSLAQPADAVENTELRNGSGSRFGLRGTEDLGGGLKAVFQIEHRFNADTGSAGTRFWEGKSIVGLEGGFGRVTLGREENPAYTFGQNPADPWGSDTVAGNGSIVNGRIGTNRYSDSLNYRYSDGGFTIAAQITEGEGLDDRPYSLGLAYAVGPLRLGVGFENPGNANDNWVTVKGSYNFGAFALRGLIGNGTNVNGQKHQSWLLAATTKIGAGELRASFGQLTNKDLYVVADRQFAFGYHYAMSRRTTLYADLISETRDNMPADRKSTGWDVGIKHDF
ncbi:MAG: hypothetical protein A3E25_23510 [Burkholderiales bacterium RIFCSPHIGHO2_12_FULL_69_20]|nr:MAG: hypothetical protein A3E25_23510 [Burkholderiales bacterium RIFCSPHIGHO2_12_FULL_69_20]